MICDLSTFIQFLAAIYVTITLDSLLCKRFWSPDYYNMVIDSINRIGFQNSSNIQGKLEENIRRKAFQLEETSRKRGAYLLFTCVLLLIYIGFENKVNIENVSELRLHYFPIFIALLYLLGVFLIRINGAFIKWGYVFVHLSMIILFFIAGQVLVSNDIVSNYINLSYFRFVDFTKIILVVLLLLPVFYQLFINWVYSTAYRYYIETSLAEEANLYRQAKSALEREDKNLRPTEYLEVFSNLYFDSKSKDQHITELNKFLYKRIVDISSVPLRLKL